MVGEIIPESRATSVGIRTELNLKSNHEGQQSDYLTYSVLGILMEERKVEKIKQNTRSYYVRLGNK